MQAPPVWHGCCCVVPWFFHICKTASFEPVPCHSGGSGGCVRETRQPLRVCVRRVFDAVVGCGYWPLWQVKSFFPNMALTLVRRATAELPKNTYLFRCDPKYTKLEIKEYLQKLYNVKVASVATINSLGACGVVPRAVLHAHAVLALLLFCGVPRGVAGCGTRVVVGVWAGHGAWGCHPVTQLHPVAVARPAVERSETAVTTNLCLSRLLCVVLLRRGVGVVWGVPARAHFSSSAVCREVRGAVLGPPSGRSCPA